MTRLLHWIVGREPVATATGMAAIVTAALGVGAAFGLNITAEQIAAIGALAAAIAGWAGRSAVTPVVSITQSRPDHDSHLEDVMSDIDRYDDSQRGAIPLALLILLIVAVIFVGGLFASCDALFEDEDEKNDLGSARVELVSHDWDGGDQDYDSNYGSRDDRNRNRNRNRGAFSPGPFDRSPIDMRNACISLDCSGRERDRREEAR